MKVTGEITVDAPREAVFDILQDPQVFASCVEGVQDLKEIDKTHYSAVLETRVAYMKFRFAVTVEVVRAERPGLIEAKIEGTPLGIVGRMSATSTTTLTEIGGGTKIAYEVEAALAGKLGSIGQPVLKSKARDMEKQFAARLAERFRTPAPGSAS
jgi:carbon monoxide dehydrogenase subunit G